MGDPLTGRIRSIPAPAGSTCDVACLAVAGSNVYVGSPEGVYRLDLNGGGPVRIASGGMVFAASGHGELYTVTPSRSSRPSVESDLVSLSTTSGNRVGGPWPVPDGYDVPSFAVSNGIVLTRSQGFTTPGPWPVAVWNPVTGTLDQIGTTEQGAIVGYAGGGHGLLATEVDSGRSTQGVWRYHGHTVQGEFQLDDLVITDTVTGSRVLVPAPAGTLGFIGGGAFSPDGSELAAFVQLNHVLGPGLNGQVMELVVIDTATGQLHQIPGSWTEFGESFGFATWSPNSRWVFFGGIVTPNSLNPPDTRVADHLDAYAIGTSSAVQLRLPPDYSAVTAPADS